MNILRRFALALCATVFGVSVMGLVWSHLAVATVRDRDVVKGWLEEGGVYENFVDTVLEQAKNSAANEGLPVGDEEVRKVANDAFSPEFLKSSIESMLDGMYGWLSGESEVPEFEIDLSDPKRKLADGLSSYASSRAAALPVCTSPEGGEFDIWQATCRPAVLTPEQIGAEVRDEIMNSPDFMADTRLTGEDIALGEEGRQVPLSEAEGSRFIRNGYKYSVALPAVFAFLAVLSGAGVLLLSTDWRKGAMRIGVILIINGVLTGLLYLVFSKGAEWAASGVQGSSEAGRQLTAGLVRSASGDIARWLLVYTVALLGLGIGSVIAAKSSGQGGNRDESGPRKEEPAPQDDQEKPSDASPEEPRPKHKPAPRPPRKVQL